MIVFNKLRQVWFKCIYKIQWLNEWMNVSKIICCFLARNTSILCYLCAMLHGSSLPVSISWLDKNLYEVETCSRAATELQFSQPLKNNNDQNMLSLHIICIYFLTVTIIQGLQELKWLTRFNTRIGLNPLFWIDRCKKFECRYCIPESVYLRLLRHFINFQNDKHFVYISFVQVWLRSDQNETSSRFDTQVMQCDNIWLGKPLPVSSCIHAVIWFDFQLNNLGREKHRAELFKRS